MCLFKLVYTYLRFKNLQGSFTKITQLIETESIKVRIT